MKRTIFILLLTLLCAFGCAATAEDGVNAPELADGVYDVAVDSSSSMFEIVSAKLIVQQGHMSAEMTMGGTGYLYVFMGTGEQAASAAESGFLPYAETADGRHVFMIPVAVLDEPLDCAAYSRKKEKWYDRQLVIRADSLPPEAFADGGVAVTAEGLGLENGCYLAEVALSGGSGKVKVASPAMLTLTDGRMTARIEWSSSKYDYMKIGDVRYEPVSTEGGAVFEIPVSCFDRPVQVIADTTAMSQPHEIEYALTFDSATITEYKE